MAANQVTVATPGPAGAQGLTYEGLWVTASVSFYKVLANISVDIGHGTTAAYDFSQAFYDLELTQATANTKVLRGKVNLVRELN